MQSIRRRGRLYASACTLALALAAGGVARAADPAGGAGDSVRSTTVADVVVTAERRPVSLQTAPLAASVMTGDTLEQKGVQSLDDLQFHTPSLTVTDFGQGNLFNIRGIGKDLTNIQTPSGVVTYWDGVAGFPGFFQDAPYYDISNVEVLRGPQGTFAGQNATGGAVFITTNDPHLGSFSGSLEGQYGSYDDVLLRGYVNLPVSDTLAVRIAFNGERRNSFYTVSGPWTTRNGDTPGQYMDGSVRIGVLWEPNAKFRVLLKGDYNYVDHNGSVADSTLNLLSPTPQLNPEDLFHVSNNTFNYATDKFYRLSLNASYTFDSGIVLRSITGYQSGITTENLDLDGSSLLPLTFSDYGRDRVASEEVNLLSPDKGPLRWVGGVYFQSDVVDIPQGGFDIGLPAGGFDINLIYHTPKDTDAVFGQVTWDITDQLQLQGGLRFTHSTFQLDDINYIQNNPALGAAQHVKTSDDAVTGKIAITYKLGPSSIIYGFVAQGHKQNGINTNPVGAQTAAVPFGPEDVTDFEIGWKPTFLDGHLRAQIGAYASLYRGFQLSFAVPSDPATAFIRNAGGTTTIYGVEAEAQGVFGPVSFDVGGSYEHSRLGSFAAFDPGTGLPVPNGRPVPLAPAWTFNAGVQYVFELPHDATLTPRIDYSYTDGQWSTVFEDLGDFLPSRSLVNAEVAYARDKWRLAFYATNAFDLHYVIATNVGLRYAGPPQQFGVRVERRF